MYARLFAFANFCSYICPQTYEQMIVNYYKMTGDELERIFKVSGLKAPEFADRLGIKKTKLYAQFARGNEEISAEIEKRVIGDPEIANKRQLFKIDEQSSEDEPPSRFHPSENLMAKALEMINETLMTIRDDNRHIKKTSDFFQSILEKAHQEGKLVLLPNKQK